MLSSVKNKDTYLTGLPALALLDRQPLPVWILDQRLDVYYGNEAAAALTGYSTGELQRLGFLHLPEEKSRIRLLGKVIGQPESFDCTLELRTRKGERRVVELYATALSLNGNEGYQVMAVDVTQRTERQQHSETERQRYQSFIEQSSEGIFCQEFRKPIPIDLPLAQFLESARGQSFISECNDALAQMYGYATAQELKGMASGQLIDFSEGANQDYFRAFIQNGFRTVNGVSVEKDRYGQVRYFLNNAIGIVENGCLQRVWGFQRDITTQKEIESELRMLASLVEQTSDMLTASDMQFRPVTWNAAAEKIFGLSADQVIGKDLRQFVHVHYADTTREAVRETVMREGEWRGEAWFARPTDGRTKTLLLGFKLMKDARGQNLGLLISATDITERKESESRLRESEQRFRDMADSAPAMIWMSDEHHRLTYINKAGTAFTGRDLTGSTEMWQDLIHPDDAPEAGARFLAAFELRQQVTLIYRLRTGDGSYRWVQDTPAPRFLSNGKFIGYIGTVVDIEDERRRQEQLLYQATILENVSDIVVATDLDMKVRTWNKIAEQYYGFSEAEAIGQRMGSLVQFEFGDTTVEDALQELKENGIWKGEVALTREGKTNYFLHTVKYVVDEKGTRIGFLAVGRDITEMKTADRKLQKSEQFYRTLIADSLDGMLLLNEEGKITFVSPSVKNVLGYEIENVLGKSAFEFVHPEDISYAFESFQKEVIENPEVKYIVVRLRRKGGEWLWCMVRGHNMLNKPSVRSIVVYFHDDTLRKKATDALRESEKRFSSLIRDLHTGVLLQDAEGNILLTNNAMYKMFGEPEESLIGKKIWEIYGQAIKEDGSQFSVEERPSWRAIASRQMVKDVVMGVWNKRRSEHVWLIICADPILDEEGNLIHIVCSFTDITERKKLEGRLLTEKVLKQKQLTKASIDGQEKERREIGKELHDNIGQQLTTIKLFLDMAKGTADEATVEMVNMALKGVSDVINEVRAMSRSLVPSTLKDLGLADSIHELVDSISRTQLLQISFDDSDFYEEEVPESQKLTLFRVVQEQMNNIVRHAGARQVWISLRCTSKEILLEIRDDGKGFDESKIRKGLGFINIRNRAEIFEGQVDLVSRPGEGCTLRLTMPFSFG